MAQAPSGFVHIKAILVTNLNDLRGKEPTVIEARRFMAQVVDGLGAFTSVCVRIEEYVTSLNSKINTLYWKDEDGDFIKVTTDTEIRNAITIMLRTSEVVKLYVVQDLPGPIHNGVTCDNCEVSPIRGYRYKCRSCADYDLCGNCEARGVHSQHSMVRFADPSQKMGVTFTLLEEPRREHRRLLKELMKNAGSEAVSSSSDDDIRCVYEKRSRHHKDKHHKERKGHHRREKVRPHYDLHRDVFRAACGAAQAACGVAQSCASSAAKKGVHFPYNLATFLDPSGCQQPATGARTTSAAASGATASTADPAAAASATQQQAESMEQTAVNGEADNVSPAIHAFQNLVSAAVQNAPNILSAVQQITESLAQQHVENPDGWTLVNDDGREQSPPTSIPTQATQQNVSPTSEAARLYPDLAPARNGTATDGTVPAAPATTRPPHPNPMVQRGLETLTGMGFSNEGNMLTQLLEIHNGDIYKALDVLQVIRN